MKRNTAVMAGVAVILFVCLLVGWGFKHNANSDAADQENWQFGTEWEDEDTIDEEESDAVKPVKPDNKVKPDTPVAPQGQIVAKSFDEAMKLARENKKMVLIYFHADWCSWCRQMESQVFTNNHAKAAMEKYIFFSIDAEKDKPLVDKFHITGLPGLLILDRNENVREKESGFMKTPEFVKWLTKERKDATIGK